MSQKLPDYLKSLRSFTPISWPLDFKSEIHNIVYLSHNNHIDLTNNSRVLTDYNYYGYIFWKEAEDTWHLTAVYRDNLYIIHSSFIKSTMTRDQMESINIKKNALLEEIRTYKIIKDMHKTTSFIINKNLDKMKINQTINWI